METISEWIKRRMFRNEHNFLKSSVVCIMLLCISILSCNTEKDSSYKLAFIAYASSTPYAYLQNISGEIEIQRHGNAKWITVKSDTYLNVDDLISTGIDAAGIIVYENDTKPLKPLTHLLTWQIKDYQKLKVVSIRGLNSLPGKYEKRDILRKRKLFYKLSLNYHVKYEDLVSLMAIIKGYTKKQNINSELKFLKTHEVTYRENIKKLRDEIVTKGSYAQIVLQTLKPKEVETDTNTAQNIFGKVVTMGLLDKDSKPNENITGIDMLYFLSDKGYISKMPVGVK